MDEDELQDLFASIGPVRVSRMFGGQGVYSDGVIVAVVVDGELMLKADAGSAAAFDTAGSTQWAYPRQGRTAVKMPYWRLPENAYDDRDVMARWASLALDAARRSQILKSPSRTKPAKTSPRRPVQPKTR